ncbi:hypothetical protein ACFVW2_14575 [Streptomyces sp. NPDC058171]
MVKTDGAPVTVAELRQERRQGRWIVAAVIGVFLACAGAVFGAAVWIVDDVSSDLADKEMTCCWEEGATPAWLSKQMGIRIPGSATDRRAGYKVGERYDSALLAFVMPSKAADAYTEQFVEEGTEMIGNHHPEEKDYRPAAAFGRLGLAEPETIVRGMRMTGLCRGDVDTPEGRQVQRCVDLFVHEFAPGTTRIYFRSTIEPSLTPPPASPGG